MPPDPSRAVFVSQLASNEFCRKKIHLKNVKIWCSLSEKHSEDALDLKQFRSAYLRPFPGLTSDIFAFS